jgi:PAS domain S-box-containing protein
VIRGKDSFDSDRSEHLQSELDQVADGVYIVDADRRIVCWNEGAARQTGYSEEEVLGRRCPEDGMCHVDVGATRCARIVAH